jgi:prepilin-type N-terminal cleavage/methylation domain-containing protein
MRLSMQSKGFSLIELMIGLTLCALSILISLTLYSNLVRSSVDAHTDSIQDGQLASTIAAMQLEIQSAGYGVATPNHTELVLVDNHHVNWRFVNAAGVQCRGFWIYTDAVSGNLTLSLMTPKVACTLATSLNSAVENDWNKSVLAQFSMNKPTITMALETASCTPYGVGEAASHPRLTITAQSSVSRGAAAGAIAPDVYSFCIANITPQP